MPFVHQVLDHHLLRHMMQIHGTNQLEGIQFQLDLKYIYADFKTNNKLKAAVLIKW